MDRAPMMIFLMIMYHVVGSKDVMGLKVEECMEEINHVDRTRHHTLRVIYKKI